MPLCCLLHSPLQTSYSCDTWLAVGHRGDLHPPKLQQVHRGAESALTLQAVTTHFYNFCFLMSNILSVVVEFKAVCTVCAWHDVYKV